MSLFQHHAPPPQQVYYKPSTMTRLKNMFAPPGGHSHHQHQYATNIDANGYPVATAPVGTVLGGAPVGTVPGAPIGAVPGASVGTVPAGAAPSGTHPHHVPAGAYTHHPSGTRTSGGGLFSRHPREPAVVTQTPRRSRNPFSRRAVGATAVPAATVPVDGHHHTHGIGGHHHTHGVDGYSDNYAHKNHHHRTKLEALVALLTLKKHHDHRHPQKHHHGHHGHHHGIIA
ncbi:hypothetical protein BGZ99_006391 [Dissophora globulifera]|uniref:Uncharacterized protein n=1 Tax=Dissophora globulifera TaxID=979702 RepID=A0A9P6RGK0_9FUNG|nr:hypothetical protein BGZ99_006391 [Dissophora globulifera]